MRPLSYLLSSGLSIQCPHNLLQRLITLVNRAVRASAGAHAYVVTRDLFKMHKLRTKRTEMLPFECKLDFTYSLKAAKAKGESRPFTMLAHGFLGLTSSHDLIRRLRQCHSFRLLFEKICQVGRDE